ncbi:caspase, EACC1-associated type [Amycolatopsis vancoresmycina]|uniref:Mov34/MPN/PAD-1 family protein n=1 Tax=Amycolatopsis vancoresmycina DSM 44592 TaxID=1292037 RepID=R1FWV4_9PSEU|nr:TCP-1/cpn60 chaperonin family protein [Amycolatopsis vancoresmycina]EOD63868.1 Mov34/MPN/PAD-1 family protein [Amycolatopsis vancoresmycina DSM 44592]
MSDSLPDPKRSRAILIGVDSTPRHPGLTPLPTVRNNVADLAAVLTDPDVWGLDAANCVVPSNVADARKLASTLERVAGEATDTLVVYFAGHGLPDTDDGELILAVGDMTDESPKFTGLRYAWVREAVRRAPARRLIVVLDCCFSGRALHTMSDPASVVAGQLEIDGTYVLTSSPRNSPSMAPPGARHTAFTGSLVEVLGQGIADGPERLRMTDIYDRVLRDMVIGGFPRPQQLGTNRVGHLELVRNRAWQSPPPPPPPVRRPAPSKPARPAVFDEIAETTAAIRRSIGTAHGDDVLRITGGGPLQDLAEAMRRQFGDGAKTAALLTGEILSEAVREVESGAEPAALLRDLERCVAGLRRPLSAMATPVHTAAGLETVLRTALGHDEVAATTAAAIHRAGPGNVEVGLATGGTPRMELTSRLTFTSKLIAPNAAATPVILDDPVVLLSETKDVDTRSIGRAATPRERRPLLVVAPWIAPYLVKRLMFLAAQVVVIFPAQAPVAAATLAGLAKLTGTGVGDARPGRAHRVLVTASTTTVMAGNAPELADTGRAVVRVEPAVVPIAVRALAIASAVSNGGVVPGAGTALSAVRTHLAGDGPAGRILHRSLGSPCLEIMRNTHTRADAVPPAIGDPLATVEGGLRHAIATVARFLTRHG